VIHRFGTGAHEPALLGRRLPPHELKTDNGTVNSTQLLHSARGVLLDFADCAALRAAAANWSDRVNVVTGRPHDLQPGSPLSGATAVLVRPDGYIAWVATSEADPADALHRWFGAPAPAAECTGLTHTAPA
jgi:bifunctional hydroxylase/dehydrase